MLLSNIIESLPNGFHDSKLLSMKIDWLESTLILDISVWVDEKPNGSGSFDDIRKFGRLQLKGLQSIFISSQGFDKFSLGDGAWVDIGYDFSKIEVPKEVVVTATSGWIYFNDYNCFLFFNAKDMDFTWMNI